MLLYIFLVFLFYVNAAQAQNVPFYAEIGASCTIILQTPGRLEVVGGNFMRSYPHAGGQPGVLTVSSTGPDFSLSTDDPAGFSSAPHIDGSVAFFTHYSISGATNVAHVRGSTPTRLGAGTNIVTVNLDARLDSGSFPAGNYRAEVTVTCE